MSVLRSHIRNTILSLLEEEFRKPGGLQINPKIKSFCDTLPEGSNILVKTMGQQITIQVVLGDDEEASLGEINFKKMPARTNGQCLNAMQVKWSDSSKTAPRAALVCYELAIELLGNEAFGSGLVADREEVSHPVWKLSPVVLKPQGNKGKGFAYGIWKKYAERTDVTKTLLDPLELHFTPQPEDDCNAGSALALWSLDNNKDYRDFIATNPTRREIADWAIDYHDSESREAKGLELPDDPFFKIAYSGKRKKRKLGFNPLIQDDSELRKRIMDDWKEHKIPLMLMLSKESMPTWEYLVSNGSAVIIQTTNRKIKKALKKFL